MTDRKALLDQNETPEDVATLYSWANLHGAKYRDFSASRAQTREKARLRMQQAVEEERERVRLQSEAEQTQQLQLVAETAKAEERTRQERQAMEQAARQGAERAALEAAEQARAAQIAAQQAQAAQAAAQQQNAQAAQRVAEEARAAQEARIAQETRVAQEAQAAQAAAEQIRAARQAAWQQPQQERYIPPAPAATAPYYPQVPDPNLSFDPSPSFASQPFRAQVPPAVFPAAASQSAYAPVREDRPVAQRAPWGGYDAREAASRPAWLSADRPEASAAATFPSAPEDTLQGSRDRLTSRWFALKGVFQGGAASAEPAPAPVASRAPVVAVFSLAGGVGKTSLVATLGRALSARGERVLLVDTAAYGLLPFYFGACDQRPGQLRTFTPPGSSSDAPIQMVTLDPESMGPEQAGTDSLAGEIGKYTSGLSRVIVDLATASGATTRKILRMSPVVLVPVTPDMNSVVSVSAIDSFFQHSAGTVGAAVMPYYVLNQFDASLPLHLDVREVLREQLGERLLPFALRRTPAVSEALAEGMTVMDYAPNSTVAEDFGNLAGWVKSQSAPASTGFRGVRWSER
ncbi:MAG: cellulose synthase operon protein YhjQ/BcsQ [Terracidiphilus sp.]|nr:cellulose synthase operon protein YhjQ/BcsQ [Terracidiphilus sp.]